MEVFLRLNFALSESRSFLFCSHVTKRLFDEEGEGLLEEVVSVVEEQTQKQTRRHTKSVKQ